MFLHTLNPYLESTQIFKWHDSLINNKRDRLTWYICSDPTFLECLFNFKQASLNIEILKIPSSSKRSSSKRQERTHGKVASSWQTHRDHVHWKRWHPESTNRVFDSKATASGFRAWLCNVLTAWPSPCHLTLRNLRFPICETKSSSLRFWHDRLFESIKRNKAYLKSTVN